MIPQVLKQLAEDWSVLEISEEPPKKLSAVCQTFGFDKAAALIYVNDGRSGTGYRGPVLVAKLPRGSGHHLVGENGTPSDNDLDEQERLGAVYQRVPVDLRSTLPRPLGKLHAGGSDVALESYLTGQPMNGLFRGQDLLTSRSLTQYVVSVVRWLSEFQRRVPALQIPPDRREDWLIAPIRRYEESFDLDIAERNFLARLVAEVRSGVHHGVKPVVSHGQLGPENILIDDKKIRVIDWEWASLTGIPGADLFRYLMLYFFRSKGLEQSVETAAAYVSAFRWLWWEEGAHRAFIQSIVGDYFNAFELDPVFTGFALALTLIEEAVQKVRALNDRIERGGYWYPLAGTSFEPHHRQVQQQLNRVLLRTLAERYESVSLLTAEDHLMGH